jgi:epoxyqueuosine reductase QueG
LPITEPTRASNRRENVYPSQPWAETRNFGEQFNTALRRHLVTWLSQRGYRAAAPQLMAAWRELGTSAVGIASTWSERHAAFAAGLGTFSLNDALITPKGIAHRLGSVITDLALAASGRPYPERRANCLYHREGTCGTCIGRLLNRSFRQKLLPSSLFPMWKHSNRVSARLSGQISSKIPR